MMVLTRRFSVVVVDGEIWLVAYELPGRRSMRTHMAMEGAMKTHMPRVPPGEAAMNLAHLGHRLVGQNMVASTCHGRTTPRPGDHVAMRA